MPRPSPGQRYFNEGLWHFDLIGKNIWKISIIAIPKAITMTGADVTTELHIPFPHRIVRVHFYQTDATYDASVDTLQFAMYKLSAALTTSTYYMYQILFNEVASREDIGEQFGEGYEFEDVLWRVILNGTNTNLVFPEITAQQLGETA